MRDVRDQLCTGTGGVRHVQGEFCTGSGAVRLVQDEFFRGRAGGAAVLGELFRANRQCARCCRRRARSMSAAVGVLQHWELAGVRRVAGVSHL